jgi:elongation factor Ts
LLLARLFKRVAFDSKYQFIKKEKKMSISASMVRDLREKTNAGMMDCKKALEETKGDFEAAVEWLRKKGLASAAKKADRLASEGLVTALVLDKTGVLVEVNSETDFVARNEQFKTFVVEVARTVATSNPADVNALTETKMKSGETVGTVLKETIAKIGENLVIRRFARLASTGLVHTYIHGDGKIGVLVELSYSGNNEAARAFANDICLHVAAMNPLALSPEQVPAEVVAKEKEILRAKALEQGKKPEMLDKIVGGQINKFLAESCLLEQAFVKNPDQKVKDYLAETQKKVGENFTLKQFIRYELGEGLQKKANDFAAEVAAQTAAAKSH